MGDKHILFSPPMVRALLNGKKTQTRRSLRLKGHRTFSEFGPSDTAGYDWCFRDAGMRWHDHTHASLCKLLPYAVGDRLWVRENWQGLTFGDCLPTKSQPCDLRYAATDACADLAADVRGYPWRPSIHMPRWASRITITVTDVRVQRLQDISEADAVAEGWKSPNELGCETWSPVGWFADLWNSCPVTGPQRSAGVRKNEADGC